MRIISDTDDAIGIVWMEVRGVSRHDELSEDHRIGSIFEADHKERIDLLERDEIETFSDKSCRLKVFSLGNPSERSYDFTT
jgi:hypothetical protein